MKTTHRTRMPTTLEAFFTNHCDAITARGLGMLYLICQQSH